MIVNIDPDTICLLSYQLKCAGRFDPSGDLPALQAGASVIQEQGLGRDWNINKAFCLCLNPSQHTSTNPSTKGSLQNLKSKIGKIGWILIARLRRVPWEPLLNQTQEEKHYLSLCSLLLKKGACGQLQRVLVGQTPSPCNTTCLGSPVTSLSRGFIRHHEDNNTGPVFVIGFRSSRGVNYITRPGEKGCGF